MATVMKNCASAREESCVPDQPDTPAQSCSARTHERTCVRALALRPVASRTRTPRARTRTSKHAHTMGFRTDARTRLRAPARAYSHAHTHVTNSRAPRKTVTNPGHEWVRQLAGQGHGRLRKTRRLRVSQLVKAAGDLGNQRPCRIMRNIRVT